MRTFHRILCWLFIFLQVISCRKKEDAPPQPDTQTAFPEIRHVFIPFPNTPLAMMMHDPDLKKDVYYFGDKGPDGILNKLRFILVSDPGGKDWVLYELNDEYLPQYIRLSKGYTIALSNYDLNKKTVTATGFQTNPKTQLGTAQIVAFNPNALDWAREAKQYYEKDFRNARLTAECNDKQYRAAVAGYFAVNAVGCFLGIAEFSTGAGIPMAILSAYNTYQNCKSALGIISNIANSKPPLDCPGVQDFANNQLSCLEGELNAFSGNPYNFVQSCAAGYLANAAAAAKCNCDNDDDLPKARSTGDPHLRTLDQLLYDFMAVGEFVVLTSTTDNLEIQARQQDVRNTGVISLNTGVAVRMGSSVVCVLANPSRLYINGNLTDPNFTQKDLGGGVALTQNGTALTIRNAQGDEVLIRWLGDYYMLDYLVKLSRVRAGKVQGLLGNYDGKPGNDLVLRNGQPIRPTFEELYPRFADDWRLEQSKSLFVYEAGKNTESYTERNFPRSRANLTPERRQWAKGICRQAGVTDPEYLQDCIYDVAITGDEALAQSSLWAEKVDAIIPAAALPENSDLKQFTKVRLEIGPSDDLEQANLIDFDTGKTYPFKDAPAHLNNIDAIGFVYCSANLAIPSHIQECKYSCGTGGVWDEALRNQWKVFRTGTICYSRTQDSTTAVPVEQWNNIQSAATLRGLTSRLRLTKDNYFPYGEAELERSGNACSPQYLQNKALYAFMTQEGKTGVFRITANGIANDRRWYDLDIKIEK